MKTAAFLKQMRKPKSKISCMVILWARAEGKSGWVQGGGGSLQEMEYKSLNCLNHFEIDSFLSWKTNKIGFFLFHFEAFLEIELFNIALGCLT